MRIAGLLFGEDSWRFIEYIDSNQSVKIGLRDFSLDASQYLEFSVFFRDIHYTKYKVEITGRMKSNGYIFPSASKEIIIENKKEI